MPTAAPTATDGTRCPDPSGFGLRVLDVSKTFPGTRALDGISVEVGRGVIHAVLGGNGSGKSTLIKILTGVHAADPGGTIEVGAAKVAAEKINPAWARAAGISVVHQDLGLFPEASVAENLCASSSYPRRAGQIKWREVNRVGAEALSRFGIDVDPKAPLVELRPSEQTLVAVARALRGREDFHDGLLILDEPTARLPAAEVETILSALKRFRDAGQTILYVSHRLDEVMSMADEVTILRDGKVVASRPVEGLTEEGLVTLVAGRTLAAMEPRAAGTSSRPELLRVSGLSGGQIDGVDLTLNAGEIVGVAGVVGAGRTSFLEMIFGALPRRAGGVTVGGDPLPAGDINAALAHGIRYVAEDRATQTGFLDLTIGENLSAGDLRNYGTWRFSYGTERRDAWEAITQFAIRTPGQGSTLSTLSGGNQQKVIIARVIRQNPRVLLLDEPTQGVDVGARAEIYGYISEAIEGGASAIIVSSDFDELAQLADRVVVLEGGALRDEKRRGEFDRHWLTRRLYGT